MAPRLRSREEKIAHLLKSCGMEEPDKAEEKRQKYLALSDHELEMHLRISRRAALAKKRSSPGSP